MNHQKLSTRKSSFLLLEVLLALSLITLLLFPLISRELWWKTHLQSQQQCEQLQRIYHLAYVDLICLYDQTNRLSALENQEGNYTYTMTYPDSKKLYQLKYQFKKIKKCGKVTFFELSLTTPLDPQIHYFPVTVSS